MTEPHTPPAAPFLPPARRPAAPYGPAAPASAPLPPFVAAASPVPSPAPAPAPDEELLPWELPGETLSAAPVNPSAAPADADDLAWLDTLDESLRRVGDGEVLSVDDLLLDEPVPGVPEPATEPEAEPEPAVDGVEEVLAEAEISVLLPEPLEPAELEVAGAPAPQGVEAAWEAEEASAAELPVLEPEPVAAESPAAAPLAEVAEQLERIAARLRSAAPGELLQPGADPLEVFLAGYALGYRQREARGG